MAIVILRVVRHRGLRTVVSCIESGTTVVITAWVCQEEVFDRGYMDFTVKEGVEIQC